MLESIEPIVPWSHTIRGVQGTIGTIGKKARLRSRPLEAARGKLHDGGTSAAAAALLACGALLLLRVGDGERAACGGLCGDVAGDGRSTTGLARNIGACNLNTAALRDLLSYATTPPSGRAAPSPPAGEAAALLPRERLRGDRLQPARRRRLRGDWHGDAGRLGPQRPGGGAPRRSSCGRACSAASASFQSHARLRGSRRTSTWAASSCRRRRWRQWRASTSPATSTTPASSARSTTESGMDRTSAFQPMPKTEGSL